MTEQVRPEPKLPHTFKLVRHEDVSGVSGTGVVAQGVIFANGKVALTWLTKVSSVTVYDSIEECAEIVTHGGKSSIYMTPPVGCVQCGAGNSAITCCEMCGSNMGPKYDGELWPMTTKANAEHNIRNAVAKELEDWTLNPEANGNADDNTLATVRTLAASVRDKWPNFPDNYKPYTSTRRAPVAVVTQVAPLR